MARSRRSTQTALLVDGHSERALVKLYPQLAAATGRRFIKPAVISVNGLARRERIAAECVNRIAILEARYGTLDDILVLLDRETNPLCAGGLAAQVQSAIRQRFTSRQGRRVSVVIKDKKFENWLVADVTAIRELGGRFKLSQSQLRIITPDRADSIADAEQLLRSAAARPGYNKTHDAMQIMAKADLLRIAENSRSFRRMLRCVEHPSYAHQSRVAQIVTHSRRRASP